MRSRGVQRLLVTGYWGEAQRPEPEGRLLGELFVAAGMDLRAVRWLHCNSPGMRSYRFRTFRR